MPNDIYSPNRDHEASQYNKEINRKIEEHYGKVIQIQDTIGSLDYQGIDKIINDKDPWQIKNIKYEGFDTVTIPVDYFEKYKRIKNLYIFHSYYVETSSYLKQYVIFRFHDLLKFKQNGTRKRGAGEFSNALDTDNGTDFHYWNYSSINDIFLEKKIPTPYVVSSEYMLMDTDDE